MIKKLLVRLIHAYQYFISPMTPPACRFSPTCSHYAVDAITRHGAIKGGWLSVKRILRCNPWQPGGHDPVP